MDILKEKVAVKVDLNDMKQVIQIVQSCIGTNFIARWAELAVQIAIDAVKTVMMEGGCEGD